MITQRYTAHLTPLPTTSITKAQLSMPRSLRDTPKAYAHTCRMSYEPDLQSLADGSLGEVNEETNEDRDDLLGAGSSNLPTEPLPCQ